MQFAPNGHLWDRSIILIEEANIVRNDYRKLLDQFGMRASMSRKGNRYDNAPMESFWGSLKNELKHHQQYQTRAHARAAVQEYIEIFYNRQQRHSRLGFQSPAVFAEISKYLQSA